MKKVAAADVLFGVLLHQLRALQSPTQVAGFFQFYR
jgi:hypothetical protein